MVFMPLGALLPFVITISIIDFMGVYAAYPNIIKYMMDEEDARAIIEKKHFYNESGRGYGDEDDEDEFLEETSSSEEAEA